jgi:hypothetical protein
MTFRPSFPALSSFPGSVSTLSMPLFHSNGDFG